MSRFSTRGGRTSSLGRPNRPMRRLLAAALGLGLASLLLTIQLPHRHGDGSSTSHQSHSCQVCKIQQNLAASAPDAVESLPQHAAFTARLLGSYSAPRPTLTLDPTAPRGPPVLS